MREGAQPTTTTVRRVGRADAADVLVLALTGELDAAVALSLPTRLFDAVEPHHEAVVLDMSEVTFISVAGARALTDYAAALAELGRPLLLARCRPTVAEMIRNSGSPRTVSHHPSVSAALTAHRSTHTEGPEGPALDEGLPLLRQRARNLPDALQTRPLVAGAIDELRNRYGLSDSDAAFTLLRQTSQRYNLRLRSLALAFLSAPPASPDHPLWFGGRRRDAPPPITFAQPNRQWSRNRGSFLAAVLDTAMSIMDSKAGYVQLVDRFIGGLQLESQHGLPREVRRYLAHADRAAHPRDPTLPTTRAVTVDFDAASVAALHAQGLGRVHSVPLVAETSRSRASRPRCTARRAAPPPRTRQRRWACCPRRAPDG